MAMGVLSVSVLAVQVMVWSVGPLSVGQATMVEHTQRINSTGRASFVIPTTGVYHVSATVDPDFNTATVKDLVVQKNALTMFTLHGKKIIASAAMFSHMTRNDVITVRVSDAADNENNRLSIAFVSSGEDHRTVKITRNLTIPAGHDVPFDREWNPQQGWVTRSGNQDYLIVQRLGVYWVTVWVNPTSPRGAGFSVTLYNPSFGSLFWYEMFTVWADLGRSVSCSGAVLMEEGTRLKLTSKDDVNYLDSESFMSFTFLSQRLNTAITGRMHFPSLRVGCQKQCQNPNWNQGSRRRRHAHYTVDEPNASQGHHSQSYANVTHSVHTRSIIPGQDISNYEVRWINEMFLFNLGGMAVRRGNTVTIPDTGVYLVGIRPDSAAGETLTIVMHRNFRFAWQTFAEGTPSGEAFAMTFDLNDTLTFYAYGSCTVQRGTIVSVALVQG